MGRRGQRCATWIASIVQCIVDMALLDVGRFWGEEAPAAAAGSVTVASLHQLASERARGRQSVATSAAGGRKRLRLQAEEGQTGLPVEEQSGDGVAMAAGLAPLTRPVRTGSSQAVHRRLPAWISHPTLVEADIASGSAPLSSVPLPPVLTSNLQAMGYSSLFPVQVTVIPEILPSPSLPPRDVCVCAPTGCGKTLCYVVPMVTAILNCAVRQVRGVVVVPSRALARQVATVFSHVAAHTNILSGLLCGDTGLDAEAALLSDPVSFPASSLVDVVIATPGRLTEHLQRGSFASLRYLRFLVMDEADKLLSQQLYSWLPLLLQQTTPTSLVGLSGWLHHKSDIAEILPPSLSLSPRPFPLPSLHVPSSAVCASDLLAAHQHVQKLLLSATMTQDPEALAMLQLHRPQLFSVAVPCAGHNDMNLAPPSSLREAMVTCQASLKPLVLVHLLTSRLLPSCGGGEGREEEEEGRSAVLCFTNSKESSQRLKVVLSHFNMFHVAMVTKDVPQRERRRVLRQFMRGEIQVLVCSDAIARGMDLPVCSCVVNYDPPSIFRTYLHRVGRTARAGGTGHALSLLAREQLSSFQRMLRVARRPRMEEIIVDLALLQPLRQQYEEALAALKNTVRTQ